MNIIQQKNHSSFFSKFLETRSVFLTKDFLKTAYIPDDLLHRSEQIKQAANILAPSLKLEQPSNVFVYGKTGTGKTATVKHTLKALQAIASERGIPVKWFYVNCKLKRVADTEYRLIAQLAEQLGKALPPTGLPTQEIYNAFFKALDKEKQHVIIVLDEIDQLVNKAGDEVLYNLARINEYIKQASISIIGISNDLMLIDRLEPRVRSSLSEEEIFFPPYNALQIQDILSQRASQAFREGALGEGVIEKCSALAAREHGDARRALDLLRIAGEIADRNGFHKTLIEHVDAADEKIERDRVLEILTSQPKQFQAALYSIIEVFSKKERKIFTGEIYDFYKIICARAGLKPLTQRRLSDIIAELDMLGIITANTISKGRYGRTREIALSEPKSSNIRMSAVLQDALGF